MSRGLNRSRIAFERPDIALGALAKRCVSVSVKRFFTETPQGFARWHNAGCSLQVYLTRSIDE